MTSQVGAGILLFVVPTSPKLSQEIIRIRNEIEKLAVPTAAYYGIGITNDRLHIATTAGHHTTAREIPIGNERTAPHVTARIREILTSDHLRPVAAGYISRDTALLSRVASDLWLTADITPVFLRHTDSPVTGDTVIRLSEDVPEEFDEQHALKIRLGDANEVLVRDLVTLDAYRGTVGNDTLANLKETVKRFRGHSLLYISSTPRGGGVALMRHALIRLFRLIGVDAHWHVMDADPEVFEITKRKFFNVLQGVSDPRIALTDTDRSVYRKWIARNADILADAIRRSDVIVVDDLQPSGLIPHIRRINPDAHIIYRSHMHIDSALIADRDSQQHAVWDFLRESIMSADRFISHPVPSFVPQDIPKEKTVFMPATTDPVDGLNKPLTADDTGYYLKLFNMYLLEHGQTPLDTSRPYIIQIARFDPSKGIPDVIGAYRTLRRDLSDVPAPQLVIAGNGAVDDPEGEPILNITRDLIRSEPYATIGPDIKLARLPENDQLLNTLLRRSRVALQLSLREGFEIKVTEALMKGIPVIAYRTGGIPLQVRHGETGFLTEPGDTDAVARHLKTLLTDTVLYGRMAKAAAERAYNGFFTVANATRWLELVLELPGSGGH